MNARFRILIVFLIGATFSFVPGNAEPLSSFQAGIDAYEQGAYETAKTKFSKTLETNETAAARHNLALTELQLKNPAEAIWQLERALLLNPSNSEYRNKLNLVRQQLGLATTSPKWYYQLTGLVLPSAWIIIASLSFWLLLALLILPGLIGKKVDILIQSGRFSSLLAFALSLAAIWLNTRLLQTGIVLSAENTALHAAPASAAPETGFVRSGERARISDRYNDFYQIEAEGSATGWIAKDNFRLLRD